MTETQLNNQQKSIFSLNPIDQSEASFLEKASIQMHSMDPPELMNRKLDNNITLEDNQGSKSFRKNKPRKVDTVVSISPDASPSGKSISPSLKKMFGVLGSLGRGIKKNISVLSGRSINSMAANLQKIQEKLKFLRFLTNIAKIMKILAFFIYF